MNIYRKYSNNNVIPALLFAGVLTDELLASIVGSATIEFLSESGKIALPG